MAYPELVKTNHDFTHKGRGYAVKNDTIVSIQQPTTAKDFAVDGQGNVSVVWFDCGIGNCDVFFSGSTDGGANFSASTNLSANPGISVVAQTAVDDQGNINVVWGNCGIGNCDAFFSRSTDGGQSFSAPLRSVDRPSQCEFDSIQTGLGTVCDPTGIVQQRGDSLQSLLPEMQ